MQFLNPAFLLGLGAAILPLVIHLFSRRRPKDVAFPAVEFLESMKTERLRRLRFRQLLALLLRTLAIVMIALAFSRPALKGSMGKNARTAGVVIIDSSAGMRAVADGETLFDTAKRAVPALMPLFGPEDRVTVMLAGGVPSALGTIPDMDRKAVARDIEQAASSPEASDPGAAFRSALEILDASPAPNKEIYYLTDGDSEAFPDSSAVAAGVRLHIILIGPPERESPVIDNLAVEDRLFAAGEPAPCIVTGVMGSGGGSAAIELFVNGERIARKEVTAGPGTVFRTEFEFTPPRAGWYSLCAAIPDGRFEPGEKRRLALLVPGRMNILLVGGSEEDLFFPEKALETAAGSAVSVTSALAGGIAPAAIDSAGVIMLSGVHALSPDVWRKMFARVADRGAGIVVFPPVDGGRALYEDGIFRDVFPATVEPRRSADSTGVPAATVNRFDLSHPLLRGLSMKGDFHRPAVRSYLRMVPRGTVRTAARFSDGSVALGTASCGKGRSVVFGMDATLGSGDFPLTGLFAPLVARAVRYAAGGEPFGGLYESGETIREDIEGVPSDSAVLVKPEDGPARAVEAVPLRGGLEVTGEKTGEPGLFGLVAGNTERVRFAVNTPPGEVLFARADANRMNRAFTGMKWETHGSADAAVEAVRRERWGRELYGLFLVFAAAFLIAEMMVSRRA